MAVVGLAVFVAPLVAVSAGALGNGPSTPTADAAAHTSVLTHPVLRFLARGLTNIGAPVVVDAIVAAAAVALWLTRHRRAAIYVLLVGVVAQVIDSTVKMFVARPRPVLAHPVAHETGSSFPSGHATGAASSKGAA